MRRFWRKLGIRLGIFLECLAWAILSPLLCVVCAFAALFGGYEP